MYSVMQSCRFQTDLYLVGQFLSLPHLCHKIIMALVQIARKFQAKCLEGVITVQLAYLSTLYVIEYLRILLVRTYSGIMIFRLEALGSICCSTILPFRSSPFSFSVFYGDLLQTTSCIRSISLMLVFLTDFTYTSEVFLLKLRSGEPGQVIVVTSLAFLIFVGSARPSLSYFIFGRQSSSYECFLNGICRLFFRNEILFFALLLISSLHLYQNSRFMFSYIWSSFSIVGTLAFYGRWLSSVDRPPYEAFFDNGMAGESSKVFLHLINLPILSRSWTKGMNLVERYQSLRPFLEVLIKLVGEWCGYLGKNLKLILQFYFILNRLWINKLFIITYI